MEHTLIAAFEKEAQAQDALNDLLLCGIRRDEVHINAARQDQAQHDESLGEKVKSFFRNMFGSGNEDRAGLYAEAARRGNFVLTVTVEDEQQMTRASEALDRHGPIDVEERAAEWQGGGWAGANLSASSAAMSTPEAMDTEAASRVSEKQAESGAEQFLRTGKRVVLRGGVRVAQQVAGTSVESAQASSALDESEFRSHWQKSFSQAGGRYEDYAPAYRYGYEMHDNNQYRDRTWDEVEPQIRADWEAKHIGSPWETAREAVRTGWEKLNA